MSAFVSCGIMGKGREREDDCWKKWAWPWPSKRALAIDKRVSARAVDHAKTGTRFSPIEDGRVLHRSTLMFAAARVSSWWATRGLAL